MRQPPVLIDPKPQDWYCPSCRQTDRTVNAKPHTRFHPCPKHGMLTMPFLPVEMDAKFVVREREDYIGKEDVFLSPEGRPVASVSTERADGSNDLRVYAPTAHADARDHRREIRELREQMLDTQ